MVRNVDFEVAGVVYPLRRSLLVDEWMIDTYGGIAQAWEALRDPTTMYHAMIGMIAKMMNQGVAYKRRFSDGSEEIPDALTEEELSLILTIDDIVRMMDAILQAFGLAKQNEMEGKPVSQKGKKKASQ